ncbi:MAG: thioredoxin domain-containing protein [Terracidiphilus sp.]
MSIMPVNRLWQRGARAVYAQLMDKDVFPTPANLLADSASAYLRSARHQPVHWHPWGEAAFARAQAQDKPILLDIGAVWCHWCHVMDRESYEDAEIAALINEHFVAVKVDRDERPDIDARYQSAVSAITGQGGWPLTAFLTPEGQPYFGGTYIPRDDRYGRPGFGRVLMALAEVWQTRREEALETAASTMAAIEHNESFSGRGGELTLELAKKITASILAQFDARNGGFGAQPKFPHPTALDLLLQASANHGNEQALLAFCTTLEKMAMGGVYDQLAGGFHRYSVDEHWRVPHFEKMLYDNTELLRNYLHGFQSLGREDFCRTAEEIVGWLDATMSDRELGGFFASQDADINLEDDGDYFTWTLAEALSALEASGFAPAERETVLRYWGIGEVGDMHHNPAKNVLHLNQTIEELSAETGQGAVEVSALLARARKSLLEARDQRPTPFIDRTLYTGWNAMAVSAYLEAARLLDKEEVRKFALLTLDRLLREAWDGDQLLVHVIAYGGQPREQTLRENAPGSLDDYAFSLQACIDGWFSSGEMRYYHAACKLADAMIARFNDRAAGGFFDTAAQPVGALPLGALTARRKPLQDSPTPAGNPIAAAALLHLEALSGGQEYRRIAEETLASFAGIVEHFGLYAGSYALALERLLHDPEQVVIVGSGLQAKELESIAASRFAVHRTVIRIDAERLIPGGLPEALAETLLEIPRPAGAEAWAIVCRSRTCLPPITAADALLKALA